MKHHHHWHSSWKRSLRSLGLVATVLLIGTIGFHLIEGYSYVDSFYVIAMIATAQGPAQTPATAAGKLFAAFMAFVSVSVVVAALGFLFGPFLGELWRIGHDRWDQDRDDKSQNQKPSR